MKNDSIKDTVMEGIFFLWVEKQLYRTEKMAYDNLFGFLANNILFLKKVKQAAKQGIILQLNFKAQLYNSESFFFDKIWQKGHKETSSCFIKLYLNDRIDLNC